MFSVEARRGLNAQNILSCSYLRALLLQPFLNLLVSGLFHTLKKHQWTQKDFPVGLMCRCLTL